MTHTPDDLAAAARQLRAIAAAYPPSKPHERTLVRRVEGAAVALEALAAASANDRLLNGGNASGAADESAGHSVDQV